MRAHNLISALCCGVSMVPIAAMAQVSQSPGADDGNSADIVVTAQRRSERLLDVPMSVAVASGETLDKLGIQSTAELARVTPSVQFPMYGAYLSPSIRGVTSNTATIGVSANVAFYMDNIYQPNQASSLMDLPDIERIEILKGPQGTLYGQNATGGAIVISTLSPKFDTEGKLSVSYGNYNNIVIKGYETSALTDSLAQSVAVYYEDRDGFRRSFETGERGKGFESLLLRGKLLFQPNELFSMTLSGYYADRNDNEVFAGIPWKEQSVAKTEMPSLIAGAGPKHFTGQPTFLKVKAGGGSLTIEGDMSVGTLRSTTSYNFVNADSFADLDYSLLNVWDTYTEERSDYFTQSIDFVGNRVGNIEYSVGAFYQRSNARYNPSIVSLYSFPPDVPTTTIYPDTPPPAMIESYSIIDTKRDAFAAYAEVGAWISEKFKLSAGARFSYEKIRNFSNRGVRNGPIIPTLHSPESWNNVSPRVTARYSMDNQNQIYASYSQGFKSGVLSNSVDPTVEPEAIDAYEVGYKGRPAAWLSVELAAYLYNYKDMQLSRFVPGVGYKLENAASSRIKGIDFSAEARLSRQFSLSGSFGLVDAKYRDFDDAGVYSFLEDGGLATVTADLSGTRMYRSPKFTASSTASYAHESSIGTVAANLSLYYSSSQKWDHLGYVVDPRYATLSSEISYAPASLEGFRFILWGKNLTNKHHLASYLDTNVAAGVTYANPRQYGVKVEASF